MRRLIVFCGLTALAALGFVLFSSAPPNGGVREGRAAAAEPSADSLQESPRLNLQPHARIALVGNSLAERMNLYGHFETLLHSRFPNRELKVRNFGWPADEVGNQQRPNNYTTLDNPLEEFAPDTFFCFFGFNESFAGEEGIPFFKQRYGQYLDDLTSRFSKDGAAPAFVLVSPIAFEASGDPLQPSGVVENVNLQLYTRAILDVAADRKLPVVDLFGLTREAFDAKPGLQYTINGVHMNEQGDLLVARILDETLFASTNPAEIGGKEYERLRAAVNDKSWVHMNDYRMLNGWYVYGGRRTFDTETFPLEYKKIRKMTTVRDRYVWDLAQGKPVADKPDDSDTGELIVPPTGVGRHYPRAEPKDLFYPSPEEAIGMMQVPEGFEVRPFASEREFPQLANPCQLNFDSRGRLWVACMPNYPQWRPGDPRPDDRLLILEDTDQDGKADHCKVFYDKLICPTGFEFWNGGVLVVDEPRILFLKDTDGDDKADQVVQLLDGIATDDTHHTMGAWEWSHGGLLHMLEGVSLSTTLETPWGPFRNKNTAGCYVLDPRSLKIRRFKTPGYGNPWCFVFDRWGNGVVGDGTNAKQHWASALSGADPDTRATSQPIFDNEGMRPAVGNDFLLSRHLPDDVQGQFIYACVINMNGMPRFTIEDEKDGAGLTGKRIADLLTSTDKTFRPVDPKIGPDGAVWFGDWCNALIGHMQYSQRDPNRDKKHGRVYRLVYTKKPLIEPETQAGKDIAALLDQLKAHELRTRYRARRELRDRDQQEVFTALDAWVQSLDSADSEFEQRLCEALWIQESFRQVEEKLLRRVVSAEDFHARAAGVHVLSNLLALGGDGLLTTDSNAQSNTVLVEMLSAAIADEHPRVRLEAVRGASFLPSADGARLALRAIDRPVDYWIEYTLKHTLLALRPYWLPSHVKGEFLTDVSDQQRQYFEAFLKALGPSVKAIPHLQVLAGEEGDEKKREAAVSELTKLKGNRGNGEVVFSRVCSVCHRINDRGVNFGPDLTKIRERIKDGDLRASIIHSIVEPNREIAEPYQTLQVVTVDGKVLNGFLEAENGKQLVLRAAGGKLVELPLDEIDERIVSKVSSMPEGLAFSIAPDELLDLVEYLTSLNKGK
ncbi:MAG: GDSL-type esterase/lipase family protein [Pirellulaceae bacterium]